MDIQKQVSFEKFHAHECNCDYEELKRRLDRCEMLNGHRYPPTSPRHEAWLTWCAAWDAKAQAVPEGFVLVPIKPSEDVIDKLASVICDEFDTTISGSAHCASEAYKAMVSSCEP